MVQLNEGLVQRGNGNGGATTPKPPLTPKGQASARAALAEQQGEGPPVDNARAAELLQQQHPTPVPVSERLPEPGDCDAEGRCWAWNPEAIWWELLVVKFLVMNAGDPYSHWLPAHALPLPQRTNHD